MAGEVVAPLPVIPNFDDDPILLGYNVRLNSLNDERIKFNTQLTALNERLSNSKFGERGSIKKAIRNCEQQIRNADQSIRSQERKISDYTLSIQGKNKGADILKEVGGVVTATADLAGNIMGAGGLSAISGGKQQTLQGQQITDREQIKADTTVTTTAQKSNTLIYVGVAVVALFLILKMKK